MNLSLLNMFDEVQYINKKKKRGQRLKQTSCVHMETEKTSRETTPSSLKHLVLYRDWRVHLYPVSHSNTVCVYGCVCEWPSGAWVLHNVQHSEVLCADSHRRSANVSQHHSFPTERQIRVQMSKCFFSGLTLNDSLFNMNFK